MRKTRISMTLAGVALAALALAGCNSGTPGAAPSDGGTDEGTDEGTAWFEVASDVALEGSPTFDKISSAGKVVVGVKEDQPGLGYLDVVSGERTGFDIDIARWIAASLGMDEEDIEFIRVDSSAREQSIVNGDIDYYVGTYSITDKRKDVIDFAGPYFITGQGLLVASDSEITGEGDLDETTNVCSATGSTPIQNIRTNYPNVPTTEFNSYSECVEALVNGQVAAVTTDQAILIGYAAQQPDELKVVGEPFSEERYGVGITKGDSVLQDHINTLFTDGGEIWQAIFDKNLGSSGIEVTQPAVD
ncbi:glutamate ABC transporter substrate-binding protein [uncultured Microbacterium sp.]|uniref:glutamate ABC transporter substrate-binding protein n=1 Tax=uncultured Microbacterium sp. TaxID=191216 RepID=UPI0026127DA6|nr:glutamate ABC transporter substrate-binding protein [uncultured Microbacterium sp.]